MKRPWYKYLPRFMFWNLTIYRGGSFCVWDKALITIQWGPRKGCWIVFIGSHMFQSTKFKLFAERELR